jgi:hypothetical protein
MKQFAGYSIARDYRSAAIHFFSRMTLARTSTLKIVPNRGLTRRQRYNVIAKELVNCKLIGFAPVFQPKRLS